MTNLELIEETLQYYSEDTSRRGFDEQTHMCVYKSPKNKRCAIGRMLDENLLEKNKINWTTLNDIGDIDDVFDQIPIDINECFKPQYSGITSLKFLKALQSFHDKKK